MMMGLPFYMLSMTGKVDLKLDNASIAEMMKLPEAQMAKMNFHGLLSMMTPLGSLDDLELIQTCEKLWPVVWQKKETAKVESIEEYCNMFVDKFLPLARLQLTEKVNLQKAKNGVIDKDLSKCFCCTF